MPTCRGKFATAIAPEPAAPAAPPAGAAGAVPPAPEPDSFTVTGAPPEARKDQSTDQSTAQSAKQWQSTTAARPETRTA
ncbi:MAG TPA: hypothetical protein VGB85_08095 [Nannocystis sp.]